MKKIVSFILLFTLILNICAINIFAADSVPFKITIDQDVEDLGNVRIKVEWDKTKDLFIKIANKDNGEIVFVQAVFAGESETGVCEKEFLKKNLGLEKTYVVTASNEDGTVQEAFTVIKEKEITLGGDGGGEKKEESTETLENQTGKSQEALLESTAKITTLQGATKAIDNMAKGVDEVTKASADTSENVALVTSVMAQNVAAKQGVVNRNNNKLNITSAMINASDLAKVDNVVKAIKDSMTKNGYTYHREVDRELAIKVSFNNQKVATIIISRSVLDALKGIDVLTIIDEEFHVSFRVEDLEKELAEMEEGKNFEIYIERIEINDTKKDNLVASNFDFLSAEDLRLISLAKKTAKKISFNKEKLKSNVNVSVPATSKSNTEFQAVKNTDDNSIIGGKYNPATGMVEVEIGAGGTYVVEENKVDFKDIANKSQAMKDAIQVLAAKGIIEGSGEGNFNPDASLSRAEFTKLLVKTLYANGTGKGFTDTAGTWYESYAKAARGAGIINGYEDGTFRGNTVILKEQIIAIAARTLREKKKYFNPTDTAKYLSKFKDNKNIPDWAIVDISLASRENLIIERTDGRFNGNQGMTRGEAALVLKKLFDRL